MRILQVLALAVVLVGGGAALTLGTSLRSEAAAPAAATASTAAETAAPAAAVDMEFKHAFEERSFGKPDAPVTLVEYAALTCPHCAHMHLNVLPRLKQTYIDTGLVRIVYHDFPFNEIGLKASMAARCAPQENYYDFLQALFASQDKWTNPSVGDTLLRQMAGFAGLSPAQYDACVKNGALSDQLLKNRVQATNDLQISSTPTLLVQGTLERIVGAQSYEEYQKVIDRQLTKLGIALPEQAPATAPVPVPGVHEGH